MEKAADQPIETDIKFCPGLFVKRAVFARDTLIPQHSHDHDHLTLIATGAVKVWIDDQYLGEFVAPKELLIAARRKHKFLALAERTTVYCVHAVGEDGEPAVHEEHQIVEEFG